MGAEKEAVCMSFGHTLERARAHALSSHLNKLHKMKKKILIINCNNIVDDRHILSRRYGNGIFLRPFLLFH